MSNDGFPVKTREIHNHHMDSTIWNDFVFRNPDIIISSYAKSGATWLQQIIAQLSFKSTIDGQLTNSVRPVRTGWQLVSSTSGSDVNSK